MFIDANHNHPWPSLDLMASLDSLSVGAIVVLHDINLPLIHPQFPAWGVKHLFDDLDVARETSQDDRELPNTGSITVPENKHLLRERLLEIVFAHEWQGYIGDDYLKRLGVEGRG